MREFSLLLEKDWLRRKRWSRFSTLLRCPNLPEIWQHALEQAIDRQAIRGPWF
jgi:hypothetical protein